MNLSRRELLGKVSGVAAAAGVLGLAVTPAAWPVASGGTFELRDEAVTNIGGYELSKTEFDEPLLLTVNPEEHLVFHRLGPDEIVRAGDLMEFCGCLLGASPQEQGRHVSCTGRQYFRRRYAEPEAPQPQIDIDKEMFNIGKMLDAIMASLGVSPCPPGAEDDAELDS